MSALIALLCMSCHAGNSHGRRCYICVVLLNYSWQLSSCFLEPWKLDHRTEASRVDSARLIRVQVSSAAGPTLSTREAVDASIISTVWGVPWTTLDNQEVSWAWYQGFSYLWFLLETLKVQLTLFLETGFLTVLQVST